VVNKAIFLDRDGVLNNTIVEKNKTRPPYNIKELKILKNNIMEISLFRDDYFFFIITNQPDIKRGVQSKSFNDFINAKILELLPIKKIYTCFCHESDKNCKCYKPSPKMINDAKKEFNLRMSKSYIIGDRWRDILAGINAGCNTIFYKRNYNIKDLKKVNPHNIIKNFRELRDIIK
jgi:D-glycero-D-manno-heptose 1,7-bisphosphate phosphatase